MGGWLDVRGLEALERKAETALFLPPWIEQAGLDAERHSARTCDHRQLGGAVEHSGVHGARGDIIEADLKPGSALLMFGAALTGSIDAVDQLAIEHSRGHPWKQPSAS
jgi:hypothetical protein